MSQGLGRIKHHCTVIRPVVHGGPIGISKLELIIARLEEDSDAVHAVTVVGEGISSAPTIHVTSQEYLRGTVWHRRRYGQHWHIGEAGIERKDITTIAGNFDAEVIVATRQQVECSTRVTVA